MMNMLEKNLTIVIDIAFSFLIGIFFLVDFYCFKNAIGPIEYEATFVYSDIV